MVQVRRLMGVDGLHARWHLGVPRTRCWWRQPDSGSAIFCVVRNRAVEEYHFSQALFEAGGVFWCRRHVCRSGEVVGDTAVLDITLLRAAGQVSIAVPCPQQALFPLPNATSAYLVAPLHATMIVVADLWDVHLPFVFRVRLGAGRAAAGMICRRHLSLAVASSCITRTHSSHSMAVLQQTVYSARCTHTRKRQARLPDRLDRTTRTCLSRELQRREWQQL